VRSPDELDLRLAEGFHPQPGVIRDHGVQTHLGRADPVGGHWVFAADDRFGDVRLLSAKIPKGPSALTWASTRPK